MNCSMDVRCGVCDNYFIIKMQVGYVKKSKVRFGCPHCKSLIRGEINEKGRVFENAIIGTAPDKRDLPVFSISTELPILNDLSNTSFGGISLSPFSAMAMTGGMLNKDGGILALKDKYLPFLEYRTKYILYLDNLINLSTNNQWNYLLQEIKKHFYPDLPDSLDANFKTCSCLLSMIVKDFLQKIIPKKYTQDYYKETFGKHFFEKIQSTTQYNEIGNKLNTFLNVRREYNEALRLILSYINNMESYLPVIALSYKDGFREYSFNRSNYFITTFSFNELKDIYKDAYELLSRISLIYIGFRNYTSEGDVYSFNKISNSNCKNFFGYYNATSADKKVIINKVPYLKNYYRNILNHELRNAIAHNRLEYKIMEQKIRYIPSNKIEKKDKFKEMSLVDFAYITYLLNLAVFDFIVFVGEWNGKR